jgi:hypothetical protein
MPLSDNLWKTYRDASNLGASVYTAEGQIDKAITDRNRSFDFTPRYFDEDGTPTPFAPRIDGIGAATVARINRGSGEIGDAWFLKSGAMGLVDAFDRNLPFIGNVSGGYLHTDQGSKPVVDATAEEILDTVDAETMAIYENAGLDKSRIIRAVNNDPMKLNRFHQEFVERQRGQVALDNYAEQHKYAYWVAGAAAFTADTVTDPVNLLTLGAGALATTAGKTAARATATKAFSSLSKVAGKNGAVRSVAESVSTRMGRFATRVKNGSPLEAVIETITPIQREWAGRTLVGSITGENIAIDLATQYAEHETAVRYGLLEEDANFRVDFGRTAVTGLLSLALGSLAARSMGLDGIKPTIREYIVHDRASKVSQHLQALVNTNKLKVDDMLDVNLVSDLEGMEQVLRSSFNGQDYRDLSEAISDSVLTDSTFGLRTLAHFMSKRPNRDEIVGFLTDPDLTKRLDNNENLFDIDTPDTAYDLARQAFDKRVVSYNSAVKSNDLNKIKSARRAMTKAANALDDARAAFNLNREVQVSPQVEEWLARAEAPEIRSTHEDATRMRNRAEYLTGKYLASENNNVKKHISGAEQFFRMFSPFLPAAGANRRSKIGDDFSKMLMSLCGSGSRCSFGGCQQHPS